MKKFWNKNLEKARGTLRTIVEWGSRDLAKIFLITLAVHMVFVAAFSFVKIPMLSLTGDDALYHTAAVQIAAEFHAGTYHLGDGYPFHWYPLFVGSIYFLFGSSIVVGLIANGMLAGLAAILFFLILREYDTPRKFALWSSLVVMNGYASYVYHTSLLLKEAWIVFLLLFIVYAGLRMARLGTYSFLRQAAWFAGIIVAFILLRNLRFFIGFAAMTGFFLQWFFLASCSIRKRAVWGIIMVAIVIASAWSLADNENPPNHLFRSVTILTYTNFGYAEQSRIYSGQANTATHVKVFSKVPDMPVRLADGSVVPPPPVVITGGETKAAGTFTLSPRGLLAAGFNTALGPFPWQLSFKKYAFVFPDTAFVYATVLLFLAGAVLLWRRRFFVRLLPLVATVAIILGGVAVGTDNLGALIRQRVPGVILLAAAAVVFLYALIQKKMSEADVSKPVHVVFSSNAGWYLWNFRRTLMRHIETEGFRVSAVCSSDEYTERLSQSFRHYPIHILQRVGMNPFADGLLFFEYLWRYAQLKPDLVLNFTIKPNIYSSLACRVLGIPCISTVTGLGYAFGKESHLKRLVVFLYRIALVGNKKVIFQNEDDRDLFVREGIIPSEQAELVAGSGVDMGRFSPDATMIPSGGGESLVFAVSSRMLIEKGIAEFVEAARVVKGRFPATRFLLIGPIDHTKPLGFRRSEIQEWEDEGIIQYLGNVDDMVTCLRSIDVAVLPSSYREGIPKSLLEAMSLEKIIITTDVPGCRAVVKGLSDSSKSSSDAAAKVRIGLNGMLVPPKNVEALASAMLAVIEMNSEERLSMGKAGRQIVKDEYDQEIVLRRYRKMVEESLATSSVTE